MEKKPKLFKGSIFIDDRGIVGFNNNLNLSEFIRFYTIQNHVAGFIRAWHGHRHEEKCFIVTSGAAIIKAIKMTDANGLDRDDSMTVALSEAEPSVFYIPGGYFNGFKLLTKETKLLVLSTSTIMESQEDDIRRHYNEVGDFEVKQR